MNVRYRVTLEEDERRQLDALVGGGSRAVRKVKRAQILMAAAAGRADETIARTLQVGIDGLLHEAAIRQREPGGRVVGGAAAAGKLAFHFPKHVSWLNMVEIEIGCWRASVVIADGLAVLARPECVRMCHVCRASTV